jgi:TRAP-type C4-dicarboxylate transport system permease small subunit
MTEGTAFTARLLAVFTGISTVAAWVGGGALLLTAVMISVDVVFRKFLGITMGGSDEVTGYVFAAATSWTFALTLRRKSNIRIDLLCNFVPIRARRLLDVLSFLAFGLFLLMLTLGAYGVFAESLRLGTYSVTPLRTPMAIPQGIWFAGYFLAVAMWLVIGLRAIFGGPRAAVELLSAKSIEEETAEEIGALDLGTQGSSAADIANIGDHKQ